MHTLPVRKYKKLQFQCFIGVDEAGRGPLAGPLSVGAVFIKDKNVLRKFAGVKDSKKLSEKKREEWFSKIGNAETKKLLSYEVALVSPKEIDAKGMSYCLREGVRRSLLRFVSEKERALVLLDGTLRAPKEFICQETIVKGDEKERIIALASIAAKVLRDRLMKKMARKYPGYSFEIHKGYGTKMHYAAIAQLGVSPLHRKSFLGKESPSDPLRCFKTTYRV